MRKLSMLILMLLLFSGAGWIVQAQDGALVRVAHFSPDTPAVDVYVNGEVAVEGAEYPSVTDFLELEAGTYSIAVAPAGTSLDDAAIGPLDIEFAAGTRTTVAAVGSLAEETLTATVFTEPVEADEDGFGLLTVVHAIEDAPAVDVYGAGGLLVQTLRYPGTTGDGAFTREVPAGGYGFEITISEQADAVLLATERIQIGEDESVLIAALGSEQEPAAIIVTSEGTTTIGIEEEEADEATMDSEMATEEAMMDGLAQVRVGHFSPDTPAVDVYVDGAVAVEGLEYPSVTDFLELEAGIYSIAVAPAGTSLDDAAIGPVDIEFVADTRTTVAAVGSLAEETLTATVFTEPVEADEDGFGLLTVVHAIEGAPAVDVYGAGGLLVQALRYPGTTGDGAFTREVPAGGYGFEITISEQADAVLLATERIQVGEDETLLIVALGSEQEPAALVVAPAGTFTLGIEEEADE